MRAGLVILAVLAAAAQPRESIIGEVRAAIARHDFDAGDRAVRAYRARLGVTPEMLEALSWLGRGSLAARQWDRAESYAGETRRLALDMLKSRPLDAERHLPLALGASIEVQANVMAARGARADAVTFLGEELARWGNTSLHERIQKNIHLLSLEGKPAPPLDVQHWLGPKPPSLAALRGRPVLLFFWAHWCGDCKRQAPILARLLREFGPKGLALIAPTRLYGYAASGEEAGPEEERRYIDAVRQKYYVELLNIPAPLSAENFRTYGASTTPTLVLIDGAGLVRMYQPGSMTEAELAARIKAAL